MENNLQILKNLHIFKKSGYPLLVSASRKSFVAETIGLGKVQHGEGLYEATLAIQLIAALNKVNILRVHDVKSTKIVLKFLETYNTV